jgi:hypothetical protein
MAKKKAAASVVLQPAADPPAKRAAPAESATGASRAETVDPRRIMREAAWRQMFGNTQSKNPFDR